MQVQISLIYQASSHCWQDMIVTLLAQQYRWLLHAASYAGSNQLDLPTLTLPARHDCNISTTVPLTVTYCFLCMQVQISLIYQPSHCWQDKIVTLVWQCHWLLHALSYAGSIYQASLLARDDHNSISMTVSLTYIPLSMQVQISLIYQPSHDCDIISMTVPLTVTCCFLCRFNLPGLLTLPARHDRNIISMTVPQLVTYCFLCRSNHPDLSCTLASVS